ncbi:hypothetical protein GN155_003000 [Alcanivorax sp. ZXX171]|nr:hypothetical protein [Alcanivorax sp. ZXX171]
MIACVFFLALALVFSPFYVFPSGYPQPSSFLFVLFLLSVAWASLGRIRVGNGQGFFALILFYVWVLVVNTIWGVVQQSYDYMLFPVYLTFNILVFVAIIFLLSKGPGYRRAISWVLFVMVQILFGAWLAGLGRYDFDPRYNGFFNDPNQMAFWVLCVLAIYLYLSDAGTLFRTLMISTSVFLIILTMSRSAVAGLLAMSVGVIWEASNGKGGMLKRFFLVFSFVAFVSLFFFSSIHSDKIDAVSSRFDEVSVADQLDTRGYTRIRDYPQYLLFGAGQAEDARFGARYEIHSTWAALLFYYGIIGLFLFLCFLFLVIRRMSLGQVLVAVGPLVYGFSTFGARTTIFWVFCAVLFWLSGFAKNESKEDSAGYYCL